MTTDTTANGLAHLFLLVTAIVALILKSGICAEIKHGTLTFEFKIADAKIVNSEPSIKLSIR